MFSLSMSSLFNSFILAPHNSVSCEPRNKQAPGCTHRSTVVLSDENSSAVLWYILLIEIRQMWQVKVLNI